MNIFNKLDQLSDLTDNEKIVVAYMKDNTTEFIKMNASKMSETCFVSVATIYRLCQKLGLSGLSELKVQISASLDSYLKETTDFDFNYPIKQNETQYQIIHKLKDVYDQTLTSTANLLDLEQLRLAASHLKKSKTIDIYTSAGQIYFAENFKFQMQEIGVNVNVPLEDYQQRLSASISDESHIAIVISFGGRGSSTTVITRLLKKNKTPIILICSTLENPLKPYADYILYMSSHEDHYNKISSFSTRLSLLYILDSIYTCYFKLDYDKNIKNKLSYYEKMT
ncbi:MAG: MurR/RpiR family transcriptional regulator [Coprobacillus sp.]